MTITNGLNSNQNHTIFIDFNNLRDETQSTDYHKWSAMETSMGYNNEAFTGADVDSLGQTPPWEKDRSNKYFKSDETNVQYIDEETTRENGVIHSLESARSSRFPPTTGNRSQNEVTGIHNSSKTSDLCLTSNSTNKNYETRETETNTKDGTQILNNSPLAPSVNLAVASTNSLAYSGVVYATISSALRGLFGGCFRCSDTAVACLDQTESEQQKGAWFDCGQMQKNQTFSYLNPIIVRSEDDLTHSRQKIPEQQAASEEVPSSLEQVDIHPSPSTTMFAEPEERRISPTHSVETERAAFHTTSDSMTYSEESSLKPDCTGHVSFANKLEEDHRHRVVDIERSEGSSLYASNYQTFGGDRAALWSKNMNMVDNDRQPDESDPLTISGPGEEKPSQRNLGHNDDIFFGVDSFGFESEDICGDVWEDTELEEAFGIYNLNAFYSYGSTSPIVLTSSPSKPVNEKYEEVFPASKPQPLRPSTPHEIDDIEQSSMVPVAIPNIENGASEGDQRKWISKDALNNIIQQFLLMEKDATFSELFRTYKDNLSCDNYFIFKGRRITKLLLFDLVNEQRLLCNVHYLSSSLFADPKLHERVESSVIKVLEVAPERHWKRTKREVIFDQRKYENDLLVNSLVVDALKREESAWTNFDSEELERKKSICDEIMNDLLLETALVLKSILKNKTLISA